MSLSCATASLRAQPTAAQRPTRRSQRLQVACAAGRDQAEPAASRRSLLLGAAGAAVAAPLLAAAPAQAAYKVLPVSSLTVNQKRDLIAELEKRAEEEIKKVFTEADAPTAVRLLLHDAGTYDFATKTGGADGSIVLPEELNRPENQQFKPFVERLRGVKEAIDGRRQEGQAPLSWADTIVLAAKVTTEMAWRQDKIDKAASPEKGAFIADGFGNPITVRLGRKDATEPAPEGRLPPVGASIDEMRQFFNQLGVNPAKKGKKPPFWERQQFLLWPAMTADPAATEEAMAAADPQYAGWKKQYDTSRTTVTRTSYEEDFGAAFKLLAAQGAKLDPDMYLFPITIKVPDRL